jgi:urease accessory protein UreE
LWVGVEVCFETRKRRILKEFWRGTEILAKFRRKFILKDDDVEAEDDYELGTIA